MKYLKKIGFYLVSVPMVVAFSYFFTSMVSSLFIGDSNEKLLQNEWYWVIVGIAVQIAIFAGIVGFLYLCSRRDKFLRVITLVSIPIFVFFRVFNS